MFGYSQLLKKITNLIKLGSITAIDSDTGMVPKAYIDSFGRTKMVHRFSPYGIDSNPPKNSMTIGLNINGNASEEAVLSQDIINRIKGLKEGEVVIHNTKAQSYTFYKENGDVDLVCPGDSNVSISGSKVETVGGSKTETVTGAETITAATFTVNAATITLNGNVVVTGSLTTPSASIGGIDFGSHVHPQGIDSGGDTQQNTGGPQ